MVLRVNSAHTELLAEIRRRLEATREDLNVTNVGGSNYWGPYVTRAINDREDDGPALVEYIREVLRKSGESQGWNALLEGGRLDLSFEDMVLKADEPIRSLFSEEDRQTAARSLAAQREQLEGRREATEATAVEHDRKIIAAVAARRQAEGKPWTAELEAQMFADRAARRRAAG